MAPEEGVVEELLLRAAATEKLICGWRKAVFSPVEELLEAAATEKLICGWRFTIAGLRDALLRLPQRPRS